MFEMYQVLILFIAIILFSILAFKKISAVILGPLLALLVILATRMPIFETMLTNYMEVAADYFLFGCYIWSYLSIYSCS